MLAVAVGLASPAVAGPPTPIPSEWGGGAVAIDFGDFKYPASSGCYRHDGTVAVTGDGISYREIDIQADMLDGNGQIVDIIWETYPAGPGRYTIRGQFCSLSETPGNYTIKGTLTLTDWDYYTYEAPISDTFRVLRHSAIAAKRYKTCKALRKNFRNGVAKSATAASAVARKGFKRPATGTRPKAVYRVNKHLDPNRNGVACERR